MSDAIANARPTIRALAASVVGAAILVTAACSASDEPSATDDSPSAVEAATASPAPTATVATTAPPSPQTTVPVSVTSGVSSVSALPSLRPFSQLMQHQNRTSLAVVEEVLAAFDDGGLDAVAELPYSEPESLPWVFATDADGVIVLHPHRGLVGESIVGELGRDMYGYAWHERFLAAEPDGDDRYRVLMLVRSQRRNAISGTGATTADLDPFADWRDDKLLYEPIRTVSRGGFWFGVVSGPASVIQAQELLLRFSLQQLAAGSDIRTAAELVTRFPVYAGLVDVGRWMGNSPAGNRPVGFVADSTGTVVDSTFDPAINGLAAADLLGPDALAHASSDGARYRDDSRGLDVVMLALPNGWVLVGGIAGP